MASRNVAGVEHVQETFAGDNRTTYTITRADLVILVYKTFFAGWDAGSAEAVREIAEG